MNKHIMVLLASAGSLLLADEPRSLKDLPDPFSTGNEYRQALEKHSGKPYEAEVPVETLTKVFKEPLLASPELQGKEIYRFTHFPTFHKPMTFRLEVIDEAHATLSVKRLSGKGGYDLGKVEHSFSRNLSGETLEKLLKKLREPRAHSPYGSLSQEHVEYLWGLDGSSWFLERRTNDKFHCTFVWSARSLPGTKKMLLNEGSKAYRQLDPEPFISACLALAAAAGLGQADNQDVFEAVDQ
ncbi:MAG: hypothetical protein U1F71_17330 [Verrucomicrobiaceae bacterium]